MLRASRAYEAVAPFLMLEAPRQYQGRGREQTRLFARAFVFDCA